MFEVEDAPWPPLPNGPADRVLQLTDGPLLYAPPACLPELLQDEAVDHWRWVRVQMSPDESTGARLAKEASVSEVVAAVGERHAPFIKAETEKTINWLEGDFGEYGWQRRGDPGDQPRRELGAEALTTATRLRTELVQAGL